jgi:hypothetical protein
MAIKTMEEGKTIYVELRYMDRLQNPITPQTIRYRVDDLKTRTQILDWTNISSPASTTLFTIPATSNHLLSQANSYETRVITTEATFLNNVIIPKEIRYDALNLPFYNP